MAAAWLECSVNDDLAVLPDMLQVKDGFADLPDRLQASLAIGRISVPPDQTFARPIRRLRPPRHGAQPNMMATPDTFRDTFGGRHRP